jgi:hypothetical protein
MKIVILIIVVLYMLKSLQLLIATNKQNEKEGQYFYFISVLFIILFGPVFYFIGMVRGPVDKS